MNQISARAQNDPNSFSPPLNKTEIVDLIVRTESLDGLLNSNELAQEVGINPEEIIDSTAITPEALERINATMTASGFAASTTQSMLGEGVIDENCQGKPNFICVNDEHFTAILQSETLAEEFHACRQNSNISGLDCDAIKDEYHDRIENQNTTLPDHSKGTSGIKM